MRLAQEQRYSDSLDGRSGRQGQFLLAAQQGLGAGVADGEASPGGLGLDDSDDADGMSGWGAVEGVDGGGLSVEGGGCSGFQYRFGLADEIEADDLMIEGDGAKLVVDPMSLDLVRGSAVDFVESLGGKSFQVTNPNAANGCGCGSSFSV